MLRHSALTTNSYNIVVVSKCLITTRISRSERKATIYLNHPLIPNHSKPSHSFKNHENHVLQTSTPFPHRPSSKNARGIINSTNRFLGDSFLVSQFHNLIQTRKSPPTLCGLHNSMGSMRHGSICGTVFTLPVFKLWLINSSIGPAVHTSTYSPHGTYIELKE